MLKIVVGEASGARTTLHLEGQVIGPWVDELERVCRPLIASGAGLDLDLGTVSFVGREGAALLSRLCERDARLVNCSRFVAAQLERLPDGAASGAATDAERSDGEDDR